jgi:hypothetical protein
VPDHATPCRCSPAPAAATGSRQIGLGVLAAYVPATLIDEVLADTGRVERRVRRLPARVTVLFILALTLFSGQGYRGVWRELAHHGGADAGVTPSSSALAQARRRIGLAPLAALFARLRGIQAAPGLAGAFLAGLRLVSFDATLLDVADSEANTAAFITARNRRGVGAFAKGRLMTLIEVGTHAVIDAVFGAASEQVLAGRLLTALQPGMLLLGDRNFPSWKLGTERRDRGAPALAGHGRPAAAPRRRVRRRILAGRAPETGHRAPGRALGPGHRMHRHGHRHPPGHRHGHHPHRVVPAADHDHRPHPDQRRRPGRLLPATMGNQRCATCDAGQVGVVFHSRAP